MLAMRRKLETAKVRATSKKMASDRLRKLYSCILAGFTCTSASVAGYTAAGYTAPCYLLLVHRNGQPSVHKPACGTELEQ